METFYSELKINKSQKVKKKRSLILSTFSMNEYIPNRYKILQKIGEGVHGVVMQAIDTMQNNKVVAIKKVSLRTKYGGEIK